MTITVVIPTYNRCPEPTLDDNPLVWCVATLRTFGVDGIVVVDDGSTDYTPDVLAALESDGAVRVCRLAEHRGLSAARNAGFRSATGDLVLVVDDDCLAGPEFLAAVRRGWAVATRLEPRTGALTLPYYTRARWPGGSVPVSEIGRLDVDQGYFTTNFDRVADGHPAGMPLRTSMISGVCLFDRALLDQIGGYPDLRHWRTAYSDQLEVSAELACTDRQVWHLPDPRAAVIHLKFGARGSYPPLDPADRDWSVPGVSRTLGELVALAERPRQDTGARVADGAAMAEMVGSFFACYARRSVTGGRAWAVRSYRDYVLAGRSYTAAYRAVPSREQRRAHWRDGLARGVRHALERGGDLVAEQVRDQARAACADVAEQPVSEG
jgi:hypothetical protein